MKKSRHSVRDASAFLGSLLSVVLVFGLISSALWNGLEGSLEDSGGRERTRTVVTGKWKYRFETGDKLVPEQLLSSQSETMEGWSSMAPRQVSLGSGSEPVWLKLSLAGISGQRDFLVLSWARFDEVDAWVLSKQGTVEHFRMGIRRPRSEWASASNLPVIPLSLDADTVLLRITSSVPRLVGASVVSKSYLATRELKEILVLSVFSALTLSLAVFGVVIGYCLKRTENFIFALLCCSFVLYAWSVELFDLRFIWPNWNEFVLVSKNVFGAMVLSLFGFVMSNALQLSGWRFRVLWIPIGIICVLTAASLVHSNAIMDGVGGAVAVCFMLSSLIVLVSLCRRSEMALVHLLGYSLFLILTVIHNLQIFGVLPSAEWTLSLPYAACLALGLGLLVGFVKDIAGINFRLADANSQLSAANVNLLAEVEERTRIAGELASERQRSIEGARIHTLGEMSRNIAHEINTPLSILTMKIENAIRALTSTPPETSLAQEILRSMITVVQRASTLVQSMRLLARDGKSEKPAPFRLGSLLEGTVALARERKGAEKTEFSIDTSLNDAFLMGREGALFQVLSNLLHNAVDALSSSTGASRIIRVTARLEGPFLVVGVEDNGPGIAPGFEGSVFEHYFTTKPGSKGMGLGLGLARSMAREHDGDVLLESPRNPTRFVWTFPAARMSMPEKS